MQRKAKREGKPPDAYLLAGMDPPTTEELAVLQRMSPEDRFKQWKLVEVSPTHTHHTHTLTHTQAHIPRARAPKTTTQVVRAGRVCPLLSRV